MSCRSSVEMQVQVCAQLMTLLKVPVQKQYNCPTVGSFGPSQLIVKPKQEAHSFLGLLHPECSHSSPNDPSFLIFPFLSALLSFFYFGTVPLTPLKIDYKGFVCLTL